MQAVTYVLLISSVTIPEITAELAEQIVNQAAAQQAADLLQTPGGLLHVPDASASQGTTQTGMVVGTEVMIHEQADGQHPEVSCGIYYKGNIRVHVKHCNTLP